ncbi:MAG: diversity-generating retroelement protein Avd [Thermincola sp.]|jgi:hypothetical protein|nr:diversity-generating retroelement protein Avd [Thermincola sp.]MDT3703194.1 diversity-generating retroelement protein Avd [Thermincola sp.]
MEDLIILQKTYDMIGYGYQALAQFPKSEKYALGTDMKKCMHSILEYIIVAHKKYYKKTTLQELDVEVAKLKTYIRLAKDLGFLLKGACLRAAKQKTLLLWKPIIAAR